jgi:hypothetical protein
MSLITYRPVHMGATPSTDRTAIAGGINTYFKETRFDLADEGHARMVMKGGYGAGVTDAEGKIAGAPSVSPRLLVPRPRKLHRQARRHS